ncbi:MAG: hypothetical protein HY435_02235 [Candidatus Liptonbacteria bacterium]|nr:hypothetical protein [Candidatus Liptonbacteria bacterium]
MKEEGRVCQNCHGSFTIEPEDFNFYEKISVPPPTFCPDCRMQRRFSWRNERAFHKNICARTDRSIISGFAPDSGMTVYERDSWWSDDWDPLAFGAEYDFSRPFFLQFSRLVRRTPVPAVFNARTIDCDYVQHTGEYKNGYLVSASWIGENIAYASRCNESKDCMDIFAVAGCELCYEVVSALKCYHVSFSQNVENCTDSSFLFDCKGCSHCFGCTNLRNKSYYIFNQPYTKEEYHKKLAELSLNGNFTSFASMKEKFAILKSKALRKYANLIKVQSVTGDNVVGASNCKFCFDIVGEVRDCKFIQNALRLEQAYDGYGVGEQSELMYEIFDSGVQGSRQCFGAIIYGGSNIYYSYNCHGSGNLFGCVGLRNKQYCILNKQYTKEEYEKLIPRIIEHMNSMPYVDKKGRVYKYGEFFPTELSPFAYNETIAQEYFPLTKEQTLEKGYHWKDPEAKTYAITKQPSDLPDHIKDVDDSILKDTIGCFHEGKCNEQCTTAFKIIPQELQFYKRMNLPLPRLCPNCRHYQRLKQRNPLKLWHWRCACAGVKSENGVYTNTNAVHPSHAPNDHCPNEFETSYAPDRPEIVYCEPCYQAEVV